MSQSNRKMQNLFRKSQEEAARIEANKKVRMNVRHQYLNSLSYSYAQASQQHLSRSAASAAFPVCGVDGPSGYFPPMNNPVAMDVPADPSSIDSWNTIPMPHEKVENHSAEAQSEDPVPSNENNVDSEKVKDAPTEDKMQLNSGGIRPKKESAKTAALRRRVEDLRNQLNAKLQEVERARKDRNEIVDFMMQSYQVAARDVVECEKKLEEYKKLFAEQTAGARDPNARTIRISQMEARLIALVSIFLSVHASGAHIDYITSYLVNIIPSVEKGEVETLMRRFPIVFREESVGVGVNYRKMWKYAGFES